MEIYKELNKTKPYIVISMLFIIASYSIYLIFGESDIIKFGKEDGFFESLTAIFFFLTSIVFFILFLWKRKLVMLLFSVIFFIGAGEEISWGQRILNFKTPESLEDINVQKEFSLHNIEVLNTQNFDGTDKDGVYKILTINFLYKLFWLSYCIILPFLYLLPKIRGICDKFYILIPPISIGVFFLFNWLIYRISISYLLPINKSSFYYISINEINECCSAFLFFILGIYFFNRVKNS